MSREAHFNTLALLGFRFLNPPENYRMWMGAMVAVGPHPWAGTRAYRIAKIEGGYKWAKTLHSFIEEDDGWLELSGYDYGVPIIDPEIMEWLQNRPG